MPDQRGRVAFVTGATSGLGLQTARELASKGARVLIGSRSAEKGARALAEVTAAATDAQPELVHLDLMSLSSVAAAAQQVMGLTDGRLDLLVNNAGIIAPPLMFSEDGFESQWATHVLGHGALTWQLLPAILNAPRSRVVTVSSIAHYFGAFDPTTIGPELRGEHYHRVRNYARTKLADILFARELQRRLTAAGSSTLSVAAHPGIAESNIAGNVFAGGPDWAQRAIIALYNLPAQSTEVAAWPVLFAATFPRMRGGYLIGPRGFTLRGHPTAFAGSVASRSLVRARGLWDVVETATGVSSPTLN